MVAKKRKKREEYIKKYLLRTRLNSFIFILSLILFAFILFSGLIGLGILYFWQQAFYGFFLFPLLVLVHAVITAYLFANIVTILNSKSGEKINLLISAVNFVALIQLSAMPAMDFPYGFSITLIISAAIFVAKMRKDTIPKGGFKKGEIDKFVQKQKKLQNSKPTTARRTKRSKLEEDEEI